MSRMTADKFKSLRALVQWYNSDETRGQIIVHTELNDALNEIEACWEEREGLQEFLRRAYSLLNNNSGNIYIQEFLDDVNKYWEKP